MSFTFVKKSPRVGAKGLRALLEQRCGGDLRAFRAAVHELVERKALTLGNCDLRELWAQFVVGEAARDGAAPLHLFEAAALGQAHVLREAEFGVRAAGFLDITGQLIFSSIRDAFMAEGPVFAPRVGQEQSAFLGTEKVPEIVQLSDGEVVETLEGQRIPEVETGEAFYELPAKKKRGGIISLTKELLFGLQAVRLNAELERKAAAIGQSAERTIENEVIDCLIGVTNNYKRNGTAENTFQTANSINDATGKTLADWTDVDGAFRFFDDLTHPDTSEPLAGLDSSEGWDLVVPPKLLMTARRIASSTEIRTDTNKAAGTVKQEYVAPNPLPPLNVLSSRRYKKRLVDQGGHSASDADKIWILCKLREFLTWVENWGITVEQQGATGYAGFENDVVARWKATYRGVAAVKERRFAVRQRG